MFWIVLFVASIIYFVIRFTYNYLNIKYVFISLDGNIGSGKSTLLKQIQKKISRIIILDEPLEMWKNIKDSDGNNILGKFYNDMSRWSYTFQNMAFITRIIMLINGINKIKTTHNFKNFIFRIFGVPFIFVSERSVLTDRYVFAQMLKDDNKLSEMEFDLYKKWFDILIKPYAMKNVIYLRTTPTKSYERLQKRGRDEEKNIQFDYINNLHKYHEEWLDEKSKLNILQLDGDTDFDRDPDILENMMDEINLFIDNMKF